MGSSHPGNVGNRSAVHAATISSRVLWPWLVAARDLGVDPTASLQRLGLIEGQLRDPGHRIAYAPSQALIAALVEETERDDLGLLAAAKVEPGHFELLELAVRSAPTLGRAIGHLVRFFALFDDGASLVFHPGQETSGLGYVVTCGQVAHPAYVEFVPAMLLLASRRETGVEALRPTVIRFRHPSPPSAEPHARLFQAPVVFDASEDLATMRSQDLALPLLRANTHTHRRAVAAIRDWLGFRRASRGSQSTLGWLA